MNGKVVVALAVLAAAAELSACDEGALEGAPRAAPADGGSADADPGAPDALAPDAPSASDAPVPGDAGTPQDADANDASDGRVEADDGAVDGPTPEDAGPGDASYRAVNGCSLSDFVTRTAPGDSRTILFPIVTVPAQYTPACLKISRGQSVTWRGEFASHALAPNAEPGNPVTPQTSGGSAYSARFDRLGVYGYHCLQHPSLMQGAVWVVD